MIRKYQTHKMQTNPYHREEESQNIKSKKTSKKIKAKQLALSSSSRLLQNQKDSFPLNSFIIVIRWQTNLPTVVIYDL